MEVSDGHNSISTQTLQERSEVLSSMLEEVRGGRSSEVTRGQGSEVTGGVGSDLLNVPWLHALLQVYECLLRFHRVSPCPLLPYASGLSHEILGVIRTLSCPSGDIRELYDLLTSAHMQAVLSSHDSVAQSDYEPVLPRLPDQEEDATLSVCLLKDNQPLNREERRAGKAGGGSIWRRWNSLRRITLERLVPGRRASAGEVELRSEKGGVRLLSRPRAPPPPQTSPSLPRYESTGSCRLCHPSAGLRGKGLNQSAPSVCNPAPQAVSFNNNSDYASPPHPVPAFSSPAVYQRATGGRCRTVPTPGRTPPPARHELLPAAAAASHTAPSSPATQRCVPQPSSPSSPSGPSGPATRRCVPQRQQKGDEAPPRPEGQSGQSGQSGRQKAVQGQSARSLGPNAGSLNTNQKPSNQIPDEHPDLRLQPHRQTSVELSSQVELRSTVQTVGGAMEQGGQDGLEELLVEVVDKLQGLIVATGGPPSCRRPRRRPPAPPPPPRTSSISPQATPTAPKLHLHLSSSSSCSASSCTLSRSSSSSTSSSGCCGDNLATPPAPPPLPGLNGGHKRKVVAASGAAQRPGGAGAAAGNGRIRLNNRALPPSSPVDRQTTGCLSAKNKTKKKKK